MPAWESRQLAREASITRAYLIIDHLLGAIVLLEEGAQLDDIRVLLGENKAHISPGSSKNGDERRASLSN